MKKNEKITLIILSIFACFSMFFAYNKIKESKEIIEYKKTGTLMVSGPEFQNIIPSDIATKTQKIVFQSQESDISTYEENKNMWDVSDEKNKSVIAFFNENNNILTIQANGMITGNEDCSSLFAGEYTVGEKTEQKFINLKEIEFNDSFNTSRVAIMSLMFEKCKSLERLDLSSWRTYSLIDMYMTFSECTNLEEINLSSFYTKKVNNYESTFNKCSSLRKLVLGKDWKWCTKFVNTDMTSDYKLNDASETWYDSQRNPYKHDQIPDGAGTYYSSISFIC